MKKPRCQKTPVSRQLAPQICHLPSKVCSNCKICFWKGFFYYACHKSDMLSRDKERDKHDSYPKDNLLPNFSPATKRWQQSQILSRWYIRNTSSRILNPDEPVILTAITPLGWVKRRNLGLWGMNKWQTEGIWSWTTRRALRSEIKTELISTSSSWRQPGHGWARRLKPAAATRCHHASIGRGRQERAPGPAPSAGSLRVGGLRLPAGGNRGKGKICTDLALVRVIPAV